MDRYSFPFKGQEREVSDVRRLINVGQTGSLCPDQEEEGDESVGDWEGTVELAETDPTRSLWKNSPVSCQT